MKISRASRSAPLLRRRRASRSGFTLVEMLLVLAVMALLAGLLLPNANSMLRSMSDEDPEHTFLGMVNSARYRALNANRVVLLRFDKEKHGLIWSDEEASEQKTFPKEVSFQFLQAKEGSAILLGGVLVETQELPAVHFYADGTCDRFRAQIRQGQGTPQLITFDPWTCAPMETTEDAR